MYNRISVIFIFSTLSQGWSWTFHLVVDRYTLQRWRHLTRRQLKLSPQLAFEQLVQQAIARLSWPHLLAFPPLLYFELELIAFSVDPYHRTGRRHLRNRLRVRSWSYHRAIGHCTWRTWRPWYSWSECCRGLTFYLTKILINYKNRDQTQI